MVVNILNKREKADPGKNRGITLLNTGGKICCKVLNDGMGTTMDEDKTSEWQAGFRPNRNSVDRVSTILKTIQGRKDAGLTTYFVLFLSRCTEGLRHRVEKCTVGEKLWEMGMRGKMWRTMKEMMENAREVL